MESSKKNQPFRSNVARKNRTIKVKLSDGRTIPFNDYKEMCSKQKSGESFVKKRPAPEENELPLKRIKIVLHRIDEENYNASQKAEKEAIWFFDIGKLYLSLSSCSQAIKLTPGFDRLFVLRAEIYERLEKYDDAIEDSRRAISLNPKSHDSFHCIVRCSIALGDFVSADEAIKGSLSLNLDNYVALTNDMFALRKLRKLELKLKNEFAQEEYLYCLEILAEVLDWAPACLRYLIMKGQCQFRLNQLAKADKLISALLKKHSRNAEVNYLYALILFRTNKLVESVLYLDRTLYYDPDNDTAKQMRAKVKTLVELKERGNQLMKEGKFQEAHAVYSEALLVDDQAKEFNSILFCNRALANMKLGRQIDAIADCSAALDINPTYLKALLRRGQCKMELNELAESIKDFQAAIKIEPSPTIYNLLGEAIERYTESTNSLNCYEVLQLRPNATLTEIRTSYKRLALLYHPDKHADASDAVRKMNEIKFKQINHAYGILTEHEHQNNRNDFNEGANSSTDDEDEY